MKKILLISHCVPPIVRGSSVILSRLFRHFPVGSYGVFTSQYYKKKDLSIDDDIKLPAVYHYVNIETIVGGYSTTLFQSIKKWIETIIILITGINIVRNKKYDKLLVCPIHGNFFLAAYFIHLICKKKLYVYFFDLFVVDESKYAFERWLRRLTEKLALPSAECIFVMSEKLEEYYKARYAKTRIVVIRHPVHLEDNLPAICRSSIGKKISTNSIKIFFAGMVYEYQIDAIQNLVNAITGMDNIEFHICTERSKAYLDAEGICGSNVIYHGFVPYNQLSKLKNEADIFFLPMSFHGSGTNPDVIRTASPGKISEYLVSGKPILIHAPEDSYVAWYAREFGFGLVVDRVDRDLLREAIGVLINDQLTRNELVANAWKTARLHDDVKVSTAFMNELGFKELL